ncbi:MAG: HI0074 family nucleotidyltransferase substrate-binding subunit [Gammaproteobacteria bacterium]
MTEPRIDAFARALHRFELALGEPETEMNRDATIQRFEFTIELAWKAIQQALRLEGRDCASPRSCLREAFKLGWLDEEAVWLAMLDDRNRASHTYDEAFAKTLYARLSEYPPHLLSLQKALMELTPD